MIGFSLKFKLDIDICGNSIVAEFENVMQKVDNALSKYEWGKIPFLIGGQNSLHKFSRENILQLLWNLCIYMP